MMHKSFEFGADCYLEMPLDTDLLAKRVDELLKFGKTRCWSDRHLSDTEILRRITVVMKRLGVVVGCKGFAYLRLAILYAVDHPQLLDDMTGKLYPLIAEKFDTEASCVERNMRSAVENAWSRGDMDYTEKLFGYTVDENRGKPTNMGFIATIVDYILLNNMEVD